MVCKSIFLGVFFLLWSAEAFAAQEECAASSPSSVKNKMEMFKKASTYPDFTLVCAHRGVWFNYPENSRGAVQKAIDLHIDCVENDLRMTKDSVVVVFHDKELDARVTKIVDKTHVPATGFLDNYTFAELTEHYRYLDRNSNVTSSTILSLDEYLKLTKGKIIVNHEVKGKKDTWERLFRTTLQKTKDAGMLDQAIFKGRFTYETYLKYIEGIATPDEVIFTPVFFEETENLEIEFNKYFNKGFRNFELSIQSPNDKILLQLARKVRNANGRVGQFDDIPETGRGSFWLGAWVDPQDFHQKQHKRNDSRTDWDWLMGVSMANYIITDRPCTMTDYLVKRGLRDNTPAPT